MEFKIVFTALLLSFILSVKALEQINQFEKENNISMAEKHRQKRNAGPNQCDVYILYKHARSYRSGFNMNFKSDRDNNWNKETFYASEGHDVTTETVDGGKLRLIQIYPFGKSCIEGITLVCDHRLIDRSDNSIYVSVPAIRKAWSQQGNPRLLEVHWGYRNCLWFAQDDRSVRAIDVHPDALNKCRTSDDDCIANHIEVF